MYKFIYTRPTFQMFGNVFVNNLLRLHLLKKIKNQQLLLQSSVSHDPSEIILHLLL